MEDRTRRKDAFKHHLQAYFTTNIVLLIINLFVAPHRLWFYWVTLAWGIVLIADALLIYTKRDN